MSRPREHDDKTKEIIRLLSLGWPERQICEKMGVGKGTIYRVKKDIINEDDR